MTRGFSERLSGSSYSFEHASARGVDQRFGPFFHLSEIATPPRSRSLAHLDLGSVQISVRDREQRVQSVVDSLRMLSPCLVDRDTLRKRQRGEYDPFQSCGALKRRERGDQPSAAHAKRGRENKTLAYRIGSFALRMRLRDSRACSPPPPPPLPRRWFPLQWALSSCQTSDRGWS